MSIKTMWSNLDRFIQSLLLKIYSLDTIERNAFHRSISNKSTVTQEDVLIHCDVLYARVDLFPFKTFLRIEK